MRVDFYQLGRDPVEAALPLLARAATTQKISPAVLASAA